MSPFLCKPLEVFTSFKPSHSLQFIIIVSFKRSSFSGWSEALLCWCYWAMWSQWEGEAMKYGSRDIFNSVFRGFKWDETCTGGDCVTDSPPAGCVIGAIHHCVKRGRSPLKGGTADVGGVLIIREAAAVDSHRINRAIQRDGRVQLKQLISSAAANFLHMKRTNQRNRLQRQPSISCFCVNVSAVNTRAEEENLPRFQNNRDLNNRLFIRLLMKEYIDETQTRLHERCSLSGFNQWSIRHFVLNETRHLIKH